jgi:hypothetical protein
MKSALPAGTSPAEASTTPARKSRDNERPLVEDIRLS